MLHRIQKIISTEPYTVICEWTNGEIRAIKLEKKIIEWAGPDNSIYKSLLDENTFMSVELDPDSKTLFWNGLLKITDSKGEKIPASLDLDPEILYEMSEPLN